MLEVGLISLLALVCLGLTAACWWLWCRRRDYVDQLHGLQNEAVEVAEAAAFGKRIGQDGVFPEIAELGGTINHLFDALIGKDAQMLQREALFQDLANVMPDVVLVHRDRVIFANGVAAELLGLIPEQLVGREVTDLIRPVVS